MLSISQRFFLTALSDHLNNKKTTVPEDIDKASLLAVAKQQECEGIVYYQTRLPELKQSLAACSVYSVNRRRLLNDIHRAFSEAQIPYLIFKGSEIAQYYPVPELRTMGDSDILVHESDKAKAHEVLTSIGLQRQKKTWMEWTYCKNGIEIELHHRLVHDENGDENSELAWTDCVWDNSVIVGDTQYSMTAEYHFAFVLLHLKKHFVHSGVGFRQFMDIAVMGQRQNDWDAVKRHLEEIGLYQFVETVFSLIKRWFGISLPFSSDLPDDFVDETTGKVFAGGVFGFGDSENKVNKLTNSLQKKSRFGVVLETLFPSYKNMCTCEHYSFLVGRPYLLPFAWIYRYVYSLRSARSNAVSMTSCFRFTRAEDIKARTDYLEKLGL